MRRIRPFWSVLIALLIVGTITAGAFLARPVSFYRTYAELSMRLAGAKSNTVRVAVYRIHYYVLGPQHGSAVVLVHGLGGRSEDWLNLAPYLARAGFRVYLPDLPGYGQSERPPDFSYSISDEAEIVAGFIDALGLKKPDLGGWSMGGWIAQKVALGHPDQIRRLILFDSAGLYERPKWDIHLFTPTTAVELDQLDALLMPKPPKVPGFVAKDVLRDSREGAWVIHRAVESMLLGRETTDSQLPQLKMPVLIVWGAEDQITPLSQGEKIHSLIPKSQLEVVPDCGHLAPSQCAGPIGPGVVNFLKQ